MQSVYNERYSEMNPLETLSLGQKSLLFCHQERILEKSVYSTP